MRTSIGSVVRRRDRLRRFARSASRCRWTRGRGVRRDRSTPSEPSPSALSSTSTRSGNQVVVRVGQRAVVRVERREVEVLFRAAAGTTRGRRGGCGVRGRGAAGARQIDWNAAGTWRAQSNLQRSRTLAYDSGRFGVARARRLELVQRDLAFTRSPPCAICSVTVDALDAVGDSGARRIARSRAADAAVTPLPARNCFTSSAILSVVGPF